MPFRSSPGPRALSIALALALAGVAPAFAAPTDPVTVERPPAGQGEAFVPGTRLVDDLPEDYVEEEYFVSGAADLFSYANDPPQGPTDLMTIDTGVPYKTRLIVRRPEQPRRFNGTVVIEWWNSTAGFDTAPVWDASAEYFARNGIVYVGVTNANQALQYLTGGCSLLGLLPPTCGTRYQTLSLPDDGLISFHLQPFDEATPIGFFDARRSAVIIEHEDGRVLELAGVTVGHRTAPLLDGLWTIWAEWDPPEFTQEEARAQLQAAYAAHGSLTDERRAELQARMESGLVLRSGIGR